MAAIEIRALQRDDLPRFRQLYRTVKGRQRGEPYDRWCFYDTVWGDSIGVLAVDGDLCVSIFTLRPTVFAIGGEDVLGAQATDLMTHPEYRGRGLFVALVVEALRLATARGIDIVYAFPNSQSYPGFNRKLSFDHVGDVSVWRRDFRRFDLPVWPRTGGASLVANCGDGPPDDLEALLPPPDDEREVCRIKRDRLWLGWRYAKSSSEDYRWYVGRDTNGQIQAALLVGERNALWEGYGQGDLRVHEAFARSEASLTALLQYLVQKTKGHAKTAVKMFVSDPLIEAALPRARFRRTGTHPLLVRRLSARPLKGNVHLFTAWRIVGGDFDGF
jgi:GNAT superfamily N-acetyltransferase